MNGLHGDTLAMWLCVTTGLGRIGVPMGPRPSTGVLRLQALTLNTYGLEMVQQSSIKE